MEEAVLGLETVPEESKQELGDRVLYAIISGEITKEACIRIETTFKLKLGFILDFAARFFDKSAKTDDPFSQPAPEDGSMNEEQVIGSFISNLHIELISEAKYTLTFSREDAMALSAAFISQFRIQLHHALAKIVEQEALKKSGVLKISELARGDEDDEEERTLFIPNPISPAEQRRRLDEAERRRASTPAQAPVSDPEAVDLEEGRATNELVDVRTTAPVVDGAVEIGKATDGIVVSTTNAEGRVVLVDFVPSEGDLDEGVITEEAAKKDKDNGFGDEEETVARERTPDEKSLFAGFDDRTSGQRTSDDRVGRFTFADLRAALAEAPKPPIDLTARGEDLPRVVVSPVTPSTPSEVIAEGRAPNVFNDRRKLIGAIVLAVLATGAGAAFFASDRKGQIDPTHATPASNPDGGHSAH